MGKHLYKSVCLANFTSDRLKDAEDLARSLKGRHGDFANFFISQESGCWSVKASHKEAGLGHPAAPSLDMLHEFAAGFYHARRVPAAFV